MPNLIDYLLDNPKLRIRIANYMTGFFVVTGALWVAGVIFFVHK